MSNEYKILGDGTSVPMFRSQLDGLSPELIFSLSNSLMPNTSIKLGVKQKIKPIGGSLVDNTKNISQEQISSDLAETPIDEPMSAADKVANSKFGKFMSKNDSIVGVANAAAKTIGSALHSNRTGLQKTDEGALKIRDAQYSILKKIPVTAPFAKAAEILDNTLGAITGGLGSATKADKILTAIPLMGNTAAIFAGKTDTFKGDIQDINTGDFGGTIADSTRAQDLSGVKSVQAKKLNKQIRDAQADFNAADRLIDDNKLRINNNIGQDLQSAILSKYQGNQQIMLSKKGSKFPELDAVRIILESSKVKSFKSGGKIEKENIIPTGALHKNLHHIEEANPELEGKITKKGIPVGTYDNNGEFQQTCEVESGELIIDLKHTKYIEDLHNEYKKTEDENIVINCGKFIVSQIFSNTKDEDKVIKNTNE